MINVNVGVTPNDNSGELLRDAFIIVNNNFNELVDMIGSGGTHTHLISEVTGLQTALDALSGDISTLEATVSGNTNNILTFQDDINNINLMLIDINDSITFLLTQIVVTQLDEAPLDGKKYARQDASWTEITTPQFNEITYSAGYSADTNTITMFSGWTWTISDVIYENQTDIVIPITSTSVDFSRIDLIIANETNGFDLVMGVESATNPVAPLVTNNTLQATFLTVSNVGITVTPSPTNGNYILKSEKYPEDINETGPTIVLQIIDKTFYRLIGDATSASGWQFYSNPLIRFDWQVYVGKEYVFINNQSNTIEFIHADLSAPNQFIMREERSVYLQPTESLRFILDDNYNFIHIDNIFVQVSEVTQTISSGQTFTSPSENAVYNALALKENLTNKTSTLGSPNNTTYPTTQAVYNAITGITASSGATVTQTITNGQVFTSPSEDAVYDALQLKENISNKATSLASPDNTKYPTTLAVVNGLSSGYIPKDTAFTNSVANTVDHTNFWNITASGTTFQQDESTHVGISPPTPVSTSAIGYDTISPFVYTNLDSKKARLKTTALTADRIFEFPNTGGTLALISDIISATTSGITSENIIQTYGDISISGGSVTLTSFMHNQTIFVRDTGVIVIPSGLRADFNCNIRTFSGATVTYSTSGAVINAESNGDVQAPSSMCNISVYTTNNYVLSGGGLS